MKGFSYQILWIGELEDLCAFKENEQLSSVLDRKIRDFEKYDFYEFNRIYSKKKGIELTNTLLAEKYWEFLGEKEST